MSIAMSKVPQVARPKSEQPKQHASGKGKLVIASGVAVFLLLGAGGVVWFLSVGSGKNTDGLTVSAVRPVETIRFAPAPEKEKTAKQAPSVPPNVAPPQGTVRRMEAISGTFSKK
ncbi:MAG: hypothetical protein K2Y71_13190 [Xanthobacteraceae bacterium]|nr:hypothetical protein [Xanthobacteraceae bacterium]